LGRLPTTALHAKLLKRYQMRNRFLSCLAILLFSPVALVQAKEWHGLRPLHSTRADVERVLGPSRSKAQLSIYQTAEEAVSVLYASGPPCGSDAGNEWKIPKDTVVSITVSPKVRVFLSDLKIDLAKYEHFSNTHRPNIIMHISREDGQRIQVFQGEVMSITYFAPTSDEGLRCTEKRTKTASEIRKHGNLFQRKR
jgi:hypothetical protein